MKTETLFSSKTDQWATPEDFFQLCNLEFQFTLDAAASAFDAKCDRYFTEDDDGLAQSWAGETVWCNPPYGKDIDRWVAKAYMESLKPGTTVVMLVPARTDTRWFHDWALGKAEIRFVKGRLKFGGQKVNAPFPSLLLIFGEKKSSRMTGS